jgi:MFS transporter, DHA3 family, macrolide efflux protein
MRKIGLPPAMRSFTVIWIGQLVSTVGSGLTGFALSIWIYQETGSATLFALNLLAWAVPNILVSPFAGAIVDRYDRRLVMIMSDAGAGASTLAIVLLILTGNLEIWHIYIATAFNSAFSTFQWPAYSAITTLLVPKRHLGRAGGMVQVGEAISQLLSPAIAGAMLVTTGIMGVVIIDLATFCFALLTLLFIRVPAPEKSAAGEAARGSILKEALYGWRFIVARRGLLGLLLVFAATNFLGSLTNPLIAPMVLNMTSADKLGLLASLIGVGMLLGTVTMSAWGGPKRRIHGVLGFLIIGGFFTILLGLRPSLLLMAVAGFFLMFTSPIVNGSSQAIWQTKVPPDVQGRVFSVRRMIAWCVMPLAYVIAGPLNDYVFQPLLMEGGALAGSVGLVMGVGPGRGTGLLIVVTGFLSIVVVLVMGYMNPRVRRVEEEIPDAIASEPASAMSPPEEETLEPEIVAGRT